MTRAAPDGGPKNSHRIGTHALELANRPHEELEVLATLDPERGAMRGWQSYWTRKLYALHIIGEDSLCLEQVQRAHEQYPDWPRWQLWALSPLAGLGMVDSAFALLQNMRGAGIEVGASWATWAGNEFRVHGHSQASQQAYEWALEWFLADTAGDTAQAAYRFDLARALYRVQRWEQARTLLQALHSEFPENEDYLGYCGVVAARMGDVDTATHFSTRLSSVDRPYMNGANVLWQAKIAAATGDYHQAVALLRESFHLGVPPGRIPMHFDFDLADLRDNPDFQELMGPKG